MSRKVWVILGALTILGLLLMAAGIGGVYLLKGMKQKEFLETGDTHFAAGEWVAARRNYGAYLNKHPNDMEVFAKYADTCMNIYGDRPRALSDATKAYVRMASVDKSNRERIQDVIDVLQKRRAWADLEYYTGQYLYHHPTDSELLYLRAMALDRLQRWDDAIAAYHKVLENNPDETRAYGALARLLYNNGLAGEAEDVLTDGEKRLGDTPDFLVERAKVALSRRDFASAHALAEQALALSPEHVDGLLLMSRVAYAERRWQDGLDYALRVLKIDPEEPEAYLGALLGYQETDRRDEAVELFASIPYELKADRPELFLSHVELYVLDGQLDAAREVMAEYRKTYPKHSIMHDYLEARLALAEGDAARAARQLTVITESMPDFQQAQYYRILAHLQAKQRSRARTALEVYLRNFPDDERAQVILASEFGQEGEQLVDTTASERLLAGGEATKLELTSAARELVPTARLRGNAELAEQLLEQAVGQDPAYTPAYQLLIDLYISLDEMDKARATLARAETSGAMQQEADLTRFGLFMAEGREDEALALFTQQAEEHGMAPDFVREWATFACARGQLEMGMGVIDAAIAASESEKQTAYELERLGLALRFGALDRSLSLEQDFESSQLKPEELLELNSLRKELVRALMNDGSEEHVDAATRMAERLYAAHPTDSVYRLLLAETRMALSPPDYAGARAEVESVLAAAPSDVDALLLLARIARREGDALSAMDWAQRAVGAAPLQMDVRIFLAETQLEAGRYVEALQTVEDALSEADDNVRLLEMLAEAYLRTSRVEQAENALERLRKVVAATGSTSPRLSLLEARLGIAQGRDLREIEEALRTRYIEDEDNTEILLDLVAVLERQGRSGEAEQVMRGYADLHPDSAGAWTMLGRYYFGQPGERAKREALSAYTRALLVEPDYARALQGLIELNLTNGNPAEALTLCDRLLAQQPNDAQVLYQKSFILSRMGRDLDVALEAIEKALSLEDRIEFYLVRGQIALGQERFDDALEDFQRVSRAQNRPPAELDLGMAAAYLGLGNLELANQYYESVVEKVERGESVYQEGLDELAESLAAKEEEGGE